MRFTSIDEELSVTRFKKSIEREFESYFEEEGFSLIEPRIFQKYDDYMNSEHKQDSSKTVKVLGGDSRIFILRPDITINVLAEIFSKWDGQTPLKIYYNSTIYLNRPGGKILENNQMGIEYLGAETIEGDLKALEMAVRVMDSLNSPFVIELGTSKYLDLYLDEMELSRAHKAGVKDLIRKKNRHGLLSKLSELKIKDTFLKNLLDMQGEIGEVIEMAKKYKLFRDMAQTLEEIEKIGKHFENSKFYNRIRLDLSMIADLDYYDGIVFKGYSLGNPKKVLSGGRYDRLTEEFGFRVKAIGFMADMDEITNIRMGGRLSWKV